MGRMGAEDPSTDFLGRASGRLTMLEPLAREYERSLAHEPADPGLFGPGSIVWRVHRDRSFPLAGMRALMVQALHPLAMAGVAQHSDWRRDPFGRLAATSGYVLTVTYGDRAATHEAAARVRSVHKHVRGTDPETGLPYAAEDPDLLLWIHAGLVDSIVTIVQRYGRGLEPEDGDRYVAEMVPFAEIVGVPSEMVPRSVEALNDYMRSVPLVQITQAARDAIAVVLDPPGLDAGTQELWHELAQAAVGTLPAWAREAYGFPMPAAAALEREYVRQLLGTLDLAFESLDGVMEARRRIELRIRA
jgi:uncharacterized protein (DUF2236 family)